MEGDIESKWNSAIVKVAATSCDCKVVGAGCGGNPWSCWWTPEVREVVRLKKEAYREQMASGSLEAA